MPNITVTYVPNANPSIEVSPQPAAVQGPEGSEAVLVWTPVSCRFPEFEGIVFQPDEKDPAPWPYGQPTLQPDGTYMIAYTVNTDTRTTYNYNVAIISNGGTTHTRMDPDVTNTPE